MPALGKRPSGVTPCSLAAWMVLVLAGCHLFEANEVSEKIETVLRPAKPSKESITIETLLVAVPKQRLEHVDRLWAYADEQIVGAGVRRELARNGFRAGVVGPSPPDGLADLLQLEAAPTSDSPWQMVPQDKEPTISGHMVPLRPYKRLEVQVSRVHDELTLFVGKDAGLAGNIFRQAQGIYALQWSPLPQGRIQLELTPELHYGAPTTQYAAAEGHDWQRRVAKKREVFEKMRIQVPLSAGQMLIMWGEPQATGSLGHHFHAPGPSEAMQHKLVVIRVAQVPGEI